MPNVKLKVGCDPELWLRNKETGKLVSAHDLIPGSKLKPFKVPHGAVQPDGTAAEFNTDPAETGTEFVTNIRQVMTNLKDYAKGYDFVLDPTATFDPDYFKSLPEEVRELGCNPDFNAWSGQVNPAPDGSSTTMRTASGHIHIGWCEGVNPMDPTHFDECRIVVKQLDYYLGLFSLLWDPDNKRRQLYGKAGAFRPKPYGVEYRTMSNVWLRSESVQSWIFNAANTAVQHLLEGFPSSESKFKDFAQEAIDNNVTDWHQKKIGKVHGQEVWHSTGLNLPDFKACLNYGKEEFVPKQKELRKKTAGWKFLDVQKSPLQFWEETANLTAPQWA